MLHASQKLLLSFTNHIYSVQALEELRIAVIALFKGGRDNLTAEGRATTSVPSMTSSSSQGIEPFFKKLSSCSLGFYCASQQQMLLEPSL